MKLRFFGLFIVGLMLSGVIPVIAQTGSSDPAEGQLTIRSDGFLYLIRGGSRHLVNPLTMTDEDINALPEGEPYLNGLAPVDAPSQSSSSQAPALVVAAATATPSPTPAATATPTATPSPTPSSDLSSGPVHIGLNEWAIDPEMPAVKAGKVTFNVENTGKGEHEFLVFKSDLDTTNLPSAGKGKVDEAGMGKKYVDIDGLRPGDSKSATFDLPAGHYILLCNLTNHYAKGMVNTFEVK